MSIEKPTVLLIPGAWHQGSTFEPVANILRAQGYQAETITLPSAGGPASTTAYDDADHIRKAYLDDLVAQGKEVIIVMHSYGGIPGTESVKGLARKDLIAKGKKGGVISLIYQSAFLVPAGASVESFLPGGLDRYMTTDGEKMYPKDPREKFYSDMDDETASKYLAAIVPHAPETMRTPLTYAAYHDVPTNYIFCTRDAGFPLFAQQRIAAIPGEGVVRPYTVDGGHFAMLSQPQAVADVIHDVAMRAAAV
ncbi:alpha/beta-hydrolase [Penicillium riverlandense]|uniref:alpha/beta-hydrolase n=1 Tax=Penicillium riverlandense TaxID=1903569 RepID=UPI0025484F44|nr:alpha/beta-hydrolase [Penicillium riverlandense]KAJ5805295.1 alpha/beta-hydrolase [Penicillium riverlandense]